jgi:hypothetical protein
MRIKAGGQSPPALIIERSRPQSDQANPHVMGKHRSGVVTRLLVALVIVAVPISVRVAIVVRVAGTGEFEEGGESLKALAPIVVAPMIVMVPSGPIEAVRSVPIESAAKVTAGKAVAAKVTATKSAAAKVAAATRDKEAAATAKVAAATTAATATRQRAG